MSWNLSKSEFKKLKNEFQEEISNSNFGFNLGEISEKLQNFLLNRAFTILFYDESLYICSQGRLHPNNPKIQNIVGCFLDFANRNCHEYKLAIEHSSAEEDEDDQEDLLEKVWSKNNSLHSVAAEEIKKITGLEPSLNNCISKDERDDIEDFLNDSDNGEDNEPAVAEKRKAARQVRRPHGWYDDGGRWMGRGRGGLWRRWRKGTLN